MESATFMELEALVPLIAKTSIVPILAKKKEREWQCGTGSLLGIGEHRFLVTAGHVIGDSRTEQITLGLPLHDNTNGVIVLNNEAVGAHAPGDFGEGDLADVGIMRLTAEQARKLQKAYQFLHIRDVSYEDQSDDFYWVEGYSTNEARITGDLPMLMTKRTGLIVRSYNGEPPVISNYDPLRHVLLDARQWEAVESDCPDFTMERIEGMSGSSIWRTFGKCPRDTWKPGQAKLVAIQTGTYKSKRAIRGTLWKTAFRLLAERFPDALPAMKLILPIEL